MRSKNARNSRLVGSEIRLAHEMDCHWLLDFVLIVKEDLPLPF
jgi:hypothetical protein